jgi:hypothetical protein
MDRKPKVEVNESAVEFNKLRRKQFKGAAEIYERMEEVYNKKVNTINGYIRNTVSKKELAKTNVVYEKMDEARRHMRANSERKKEKYTMCPLCDERIYLY